MSKILSEKERIEFVDTAWQAVTQHFYDPTFGGVDWRAVRQEYLAQARQVETLEDVDRLTQEMFSRLPVSHNSVLPPEFVARLQQGPEEAERAVSWEVRPDGSGYLRVAVGLRPFFQPRDLQAAFTDLHDAPGLILDLRGNRGGPIREVADYFVPAGRAYQYERTRHGQRTSEAAPLPDFAEDRLYLLETGFVTRNKYTVVRTQDPPGPRYEGPVAVLINENCCSGSELLAQFLKEQGRARLWGTKTSGQVLRSRLVPLTQDYWALVVFSHIRSGQGVVLEGVGVTPDVEIPDTEEEPNQSLEAAAQWLQSLPT